MLKVHLEIQQEQKRIKTLTTEIEHLQLECTLANLKTEAQFYHDSIEELTGERIEKEKLWQESQFQNQHQKLYSPQKRQETYDFMERKFWPKIFDVDVEKFQDEEELNKADNPALPAHNTKYNLKFKERYIKQHDDQVESNPLHGAEEDKLESRIGNIMQDVNRSIKYLKKKQGEKKSAVKKGRKSKPSRVMSSKGSVTSKVTKSSRRPVAL